MRYIQVECDMTSKECVHEFSGIACYFVGNSHDFSSSAIDLATISFSSVKFERLETIDELIALNLERPDRVRSVILNQSMGKTLVDQMERIQDAFPSATIAFAYRQAELAKSFLCKMRELHPRRRVAFLPMNRDLDRWLTLLRLLVCGENFVPDELHDIFFQGNDTASTSEKTDHACEAARVAQKEALEARTAKAVGIRLTTREAQVLSCVAEGKQNKLIANRLGLSEHTVKLHIHHVIAKLGVNNRTEAAVWFLENHGSDHLVQ